MPPPNIGTGYADDEAIAAHESEPAHEGTEAGASINGVQTFKAERHWMAVAGIEAVLVRQIKTERHALAVLGNLEFGLHVGGRDLRVFKCRYGNIEYSAMLHKGVVLGNHADRDEGLVVAEGQSDNRVESFIQPGKLDYPL